MHFSEFLAKKPHHTTLSHKTPQFWCRMHWIRVHKPCVKRYSVIILIYLRTGTFYDIILTLWRSILMLLLYSFHLFYNLSSFISLFDYYIIKSKPRPIPQKNASHDKRAESTDRNFHPSAEDLRWVACNFRSWAFSTCLENKLYTMYQLSFNFILRCIKP